MLFPVRAFKLGNRDAAVYQTVQTVTCHEESMTYLRLLRCFSGLNAPWAEVQILCP